MATTKNLIGRIATLGATASLAILSVGGMFIFTSSDFTGNPIAGREGSFEWVDKDELEKINLYEGDKIFFVANAE